MTTSIKERYIANNKSLFNELFNSMEKEIVAEHYHDFMGGFSDLQYVDFPTNEPVKFTDRHGRRGIVFPVSSYGGVVDNIIAYEYYGDDKKITVILQDGPEDPQRINDALAKLSYPFSKEKNSVYRHYKMMEKINKLPVKYVD